MSIKNTLITSLKANSFSLNENEIEKICDFICLLQEWNDKINLTSHKKIIDIIEKDIVDHLYLNLYVKEYISKKESLIDMGSGAGFCGIVLSITNPGVKISFLDANRKKINFVKQVCRELRLEGVDYINARAEAFPSELKEKFHVSVSRATWQMPDYIRFASHYVQNNGHVFCMAGEKLKSTLEEIPYLQQFESPSEIFYNIKPKCYKRKILFFRKK